MKYNEITKKYDPEQEDLQVSILQNVIIFFLCCGACMLIYYATKNN